ncbi:YchJ family metal-binding protein [Luteimonas sp BLCC-B24]|uniref:YchJ family protein n=1 Tax=Luteimonas sp. BLCC-B24 TaxID=3025317 RepID=UPI00234C925E|nr:YchJ family metal-binding protein [Luteimonas sp. BLCC-B24]MDC7806951.1 YchJ family metal-binding protein [Luteimonas sp. BLCC-B24]
MSSRPASSACPCGRPQLYDACCGPLHAGAPAPDAESLMRARYSAYVRRDADYLRASWHSRTRPPVLEFEGPQPVWLGLAVKSARTLDADHAEVAFVARYRIGGGSVVRMREHSRFAREDGHWRYVDGDVD